MWDFVADSTIEHRRRIRRSPVRVWPGAPFHQPLLDLVRHTPKAEPFGPALMLFFARGPSGCESAEAYVSQVSSSAHYVRIFVVTVRSHFPHISRHVMETVWAGRFRKCTHFRRALEASLEAIT